jgi:hypothetical protein
MNFDTLASKIKDLRDIGSFVTWESLRVID